MMFLSSPIEKFPLLGQTLMEGVMRIPIHPDYNLRWLIVFGGTVVLLVAFVTTNLV